MPQLADSVPINLGRTPCADRNDKLGWTDGFAVSFDGISLGVRSNDPALLERLRERVPSGRPWERREVDFLVSFLRGRESERKGVRHYHVVYWDWNRVARTFDLEEALEVFGQVAGSAKLLYAVHKTYLSADLLDWAGRRVLVLGPAGLRARLRDAVAAQGVSVLLKDEVGLDPMGKLSCSRDLDFVPVEAKDLLVLEAGRRPRLAPLTAGEATMKAVLGAFAASTQPHLVLQVLSKHIPEYQSHLLRFSEDDAQIGTWLAKRLKA
ncbi:hypothetical protein JST97_07435 [bacterium]|nr:hypothetical protein [bacterium]